MIIKGDALQCIKHIPANTFDTCITSPPYYGLRDYNTDGQIGLEETPDEYIEHLVEIFREVRRILKDDGTLWIVIGDSYAGSGKGQSKKRVGIQDRKRGKVLGQVLPKGTFTGIKRKDLIGIPWALAFALRNDGWYLRQEVIWQKPNAMPESIKDRCTRSHEHIFMLSKHERYYYNAGAVAEPANFDGRKQTVYKGSKKYAYRGVKEHALDDQTNRAGRPHERWKTDDAGQKIRNRRSVWSVNTKPFKGAHIAPYPPDLIEPCVLASSREGGAVLDPFCGSGTTGVVSKRNKRSFVGIDINPKYCEMAEQRLLQ